MNELSYEKEMELRDEFEDYANEYIHKNFDLDYYYHDDELEEAIDDVLPIIKEEFLNSIENENKEIMPEIEKESKFWFFGVKNFNYLLRDDWHERQKNCGYNVAKAIKNIIGEKFEDAMWSFEQYTSKDVAKNNIEELKDIKQEVSNFLEEHKLPDYYDDYLSDIDRAILVNEEYLKEIDLDEENTWNKVYETEQFER